MGFMLEQVQGFTPTPMTVATIIYYTGVHPYTLKPVYTAKTKEEKQNQHLFFFWYKPENRKQIKDKLMKLGRFDLLEKLIGKVGIGSGKREPGGEKREQRAGKRQSAIRGAANRKFRGKGK